MGPAQYHRDADTGRVEALHSLGTYAATGDAVRGGDAPSAAPSAPPFYLEQKFKARARFGPVRGPAP